MNDNQRTKSATATKSTKASKKLKGLDDLQKVFPAEQSCIKFLEKHLWKGKTPTSPFIPNGEVYKCADQVTKGKNPARYNRYKCKNTGKYFNIRTGTIFEGSNLPLKKWTLAFYVFGSDKRGISSYHLARYIGVTQKTAWFMLHRMRESFINPLFKIMLKNVVETDEKFVGGKNKNRHENKKVPHFQGRSWKDKIVTWGAIERGGNLIAQVVPNNKKKTLEPLVKQNVEIGSEVNSDEWLAYNGLGKWYNHQWVNHGAKQYVNGKVHTNTIEGSWSQLSGIINTYRHVSRKHAQRYINEFTFRYNTRNYSDWERFELMLSLAVDKRLTYGELIS
ncbi:MAG: IS1595 family transposase [Candidatus Moeniiplasma glomeromycotorum]|nr:IS1595 family transposase [Candidatus Moeniiplasma glomeromycotorum]MCE8167164.1 IS1595 family transposase [Candidatus Moeniiplasma glomeromycotorum]MCE8168824.1 IS1595 family transposase [Candidatus Moeniiplasma glomeromycotorum]